MDIFDLAISYVWEYDEDFVSLIEHVLQNEGLSTYIIRYHNIEEVTEKVKSRKLLFHSYLDRASDVAEEFEELARLLSKKKIRIFNPYKNVQHSIDKASMHLEFITSGLEVPHSIIIPPYNHKENILLSVQDLAILGRPFIIKPCNTTGGGVGVVTGAESLKEVLQERINHKSDKYILQEKIIPKILNDKRAWFRSFWAFGKAIPVWWDDISHIYQVITPEETKNLSLRKLISITKTIAGISQLDFFSTEIVLTNSNKFVVIDYVNDQCDMRFKSSHFDGVPDEIIFKIVTALMMSVKKTGSRQSNEI
ncbi:MAG: hypothetical protein IPM56_05925 [Ignavibacteriales bacterium]|nr:MAG: hypothetical protein IPM56_05925 [Ignavibacteriales bacterium]